MTASPRDEGLRSLRRRAWSESYASLGEADSQGELTAHDLEQFGLVAQLVGRDEHGSRLWERAHHAWLAAKEPAAAARCAFWLAMGYMDRGEMAHAGGWLARAGRILGEAGMDCPEQGYILIPKGLQHLEEGEADLALEIFVEVAALGTRFGDRDLATLGRLGGGQSLIRAGNTVGGAAHLDEAMVSVLADEVSPLVAGIVYCAVIEACHEMFDLRRAQEWTAALSAWCESQPDLVPFRGRCQVYRAEIMQFRGDWDGAIDEAQEASDRLSGPPGHPAVGQAYYRQGELLRLRGAMSDAESAFRRAEEWGRQPQPGLALLRIAQGRTEAAATAIRHSLNEARDDVGRANLLAAAVEIFLAMDDRPSATSAAKELARLGELFGSPHLAASAQQALGAVALAAGEAEEAAAGLRSALGTWRSLNAPYETARTQVLLARAARVSGDEETATLQLEAARYAFRQLGAATDLARLGPEMPDVEPGTHGLTSRELQVLRLIATGMTNRAIAVNLTISEKTVANHVSNILGKLALSSRAAATAYAYEHGLV